jgi:uncharacterized protein YacL
MVEAQGNMRIMIQRRIDELSTTYQALAKKSRNYGIIALIFKICVVVLGVFVAFHDSTTMIFGSANAVVHLLASILIAIFGSLEVALQLERKSERLNILATNCRNFKRLAETKLVKIDVTASGDDVTAAELEMLDDLENHSQDIQNQTAALKVNTVRLLSSSYSKLKK